PRAGRQPQGSLTGGGACVQQLRPLPLGLGERLMRQILRWALAAVTALLVCALSPGLARQDEKDERVDNPRDKGWAKFKPGARVTVIEKTTLGDSSVEEREVVYKLAEITPKRAVVETSVIERDLLSRIETSPTRIHYPAKVKKADLEAAQLESGVKRGKET